MTMVDSLDSIIMLYSYTDFADRGFKIMHGPDQPQIQPSDEAPVTVTDEKTEEPANTNNTNITISEAPQPEESTLPMLNVSEKVKQRTMSHLSIVLTIMSILLAYRYVFSSCLPDDHD
jgi:high-affinity nickel-transport protein